MSLNNDQIFEAMIDLLIKKGLHCINCGYRDVNQCLNDQMRLHQTENFTIPHYDFVCKLWTQEKR
jgi:hypothetical protein